MRRKVIPFLFTITVAFLIAGCKGTTGPAGPSLTGSVSGFVTLVQADGTRAADQSGVTVAIQGSSLSTTTDTSGKWTINGLSTGTYTVTYTMQGYGPSELEDFQFIGGDTDNLAKITLAQPPDFTVTLDPTKTVADSNSFVVAFTTNGAQRTGDLRVLIAVGTGSDVSASDPSKYLFATTYLTNGTSGGTRIYTSDLQYAGFSSGATAYIIAYPLNYGSASEYSSYVDHVTGRTVYTSLGAASNVIPLTVP